MIIKYFSLKTILILLTFLLFGPSILLGQINKSNSVSFDTDNFFNSLATGVLTYVIEDDGVYVRIDKGSIIKNLKKENYTPILSDIYVSLSTRLESGSWEMIYNSERINLNNINLTDNMEVDISCVPEIRCYEFFIKIPDKIDFSKFWITINMTNPTGGLKHAHNGFYGSSFVTQ